MINISVIALVEELSLCPITVAPLAVIALKVPVNT
jgi:hypothetical protein